MLGPVVADRELGASAWAFITAACSAGFLLGLLAFGVFWDLSLQQHVPRDKLSRASSYDALGSFVAIPVGQMLAGPLAAAVGVTSAIWISVGLFVAPMALCLASRDVRELRRLDASAPA